MREFMKIRVFFACMTLLIIAFMGGCAKNSSSDMKESTSKLTIKDIYELDLSDKPAKWSESNLEIAKSLYAGFTPAAAKIDDKWQKALYHEAYDLLIVRDADKDVYDVFHGENMVSVPMTLNFPTENNVGIQLVDVNNDGKEELYISEFLAGYSQKNVIEIEPFAVITDSYSVADVYKVLKEYKLNSVEKNENDVVITTEFTMPDDEKLTYEFVIENGNESLLEATGMDVVILETKILKDDNENYNVSYDVRFRLANGDNGSEKVYVFVNIPLEYDGASNHYCPKGDVTFDYLVGNPADWG